DIHFKASVDRTQVTLDDQITFTVTVSGDVKSVPKPTLPGLDDFVIYSSGTSQNWSFVNGKMFSSVAYNYILVPKSEGKFTIPPLQMTLDGTTYKTQPITITVSEGTEEPEAQAPPETTKPTTKAEKTTDLFVRTTVDKTKAYVNQQLTLTFRFYQGVRLFSNPEYSPPTLTGFWVEDLPPQKQYYQTINGRQYFVTEVKTALFPTAAGKQTIGEASLKCKVEDLRSFFDRDPFSILDKDWMDMFRQGKPQILRSKPINIEVLPLPDEGKPEDFKGSVGDFRITSSVDKKKIEAGQPITLKMSISGTGNIKSVSEPVLPDLENFRVYSSGSSENISKQNYTLQGTKIYEQVLIPTKAGNYTIPPLSFSYFDLKTKEYKTLKTNPVVITSLPAAETSPFAATPISKSEIGAVPKDIRHIKAVHNVLEKQGGSLYNKPIFLIIQLLPLAALVIALRYKRHQEKLNNDVAYARLRKSHKLAKRRLGQAKKLLSVDKKNEFYSEVARTITLYIGDKLNKPGFGLTKDQIRSGLTQRGVDKERIDQIIGILEDCDYVRFAPTSCGLEEMKGFLKTVEKAIVKLEQSLG
ncbi:MAG: BatD family protein, partial [Candidatus Zixiibacteriota bacterium]